MKDKKETSQYSFVLQYHKHPEVGGVGHVSMIGKQGDTEVKISIHPDSGLSILTPLQVTTGCIFPSKAINVYTDREGDSPVHASYNVTNQLPNHKDAFDEMKRLKNAIESGTTSYSLLPSFITHFLQAVISPQVSSFNVFLGQKTLDRNKIDTELNEIEVTNCSESVYNILKKGGLESKPNTLLSFITPKSFNNFCENLGDGRELDTSERSLSIGSEMDKPSMPEYSTTFFSPRKPSPEQNVAINNLVRKPIPKTFFTTNNASDEPCALEEPVNYGFYCSNKADE